MAQLAFSCSLLRPVTGLAHIQGIVILRSGRVILNVRLAGGGPEYSGPVASSCAVIAPAAAETAGQEWETEDEEVCAPARTVASAIKITLRFDAAKYDWTLAVAPPAVSDIRSGCAGGPICKLTTDRVGIKVPNGRLVGPR